MIEFARHIESLLLENDCVIVPGLGGFIAHFQSAYYDEKDGIFYPPIRTIGFNPQLTMNDGMLVQSFMQVYNTDFSDALRMISEKVEILKDTLYKEGVIEIYGVGHLFYTIYNSYEFRPDVKGVISPVLYALDSYLMKPLSVEISQDEAIVNELPKQKILPSKKRKEINISTSWWSNVAAIAAAVILFFVLTFPVENTYIDKGNYASLGTDCLFETIRSRSMATNLRFAEKKLEQKEKEHSIKPIVVKVEKVADIAKKEISKEKELKKSVSKKDKIECVQRQSMNQLPTKKVGNQNKGKGYHIIVASLTSNSDAQRMMKEYQCQGYKNVSVMQSNDRFRISLCSFSDKSVAYQKLNELKQIDAFKNAWMLTSK